MLKAILFSCTIAVGGAPMQISFELEDTSMNACNKFAGFIQWVIPKMNKDATALAKCEPVRDETATG